MIAPKRLDIFSSLTGGGMLRRSRRVLTFPYNCIPGTRYELLFLFFSHEMSTRARPSCVVLIIRGCQSDTGSAGQGKDHRSILRSPNKSTV